MRHFLQLAVRSLIAVLIAGSAVAATIQPSGTSVPGEVLVKIRAGASGADVAGLKLQAGVDEDQRIARVASGTIWRFHSRTKSTASLITAVSGSSQVVYAEPNFIVHPVSSPDDPSYAQLWGLQNSGQAISGSFGLAGADISAESAWNVTTGSASIVVGVVDTGVDYNHPDLAANIWSNPGGKGNAACAAGTHGYNAITGTCDPMDDHYHGTHVSGTIGAAGNNGIGVTGVNWTTSIMGLKFINSVGNGTTADAILAIDFAVQAKIDGVNVRVLSNSWGGGAFSKALLDEINKANENDILFVAAAGNSSRNTDLFPHYPSSYATPNMISVAATDNRDERAYFSNYGSTSVHLGAPGMDVLSTIPGGGYYYLSGTSMATPHVSGVAALVLANTPGLTTAEVKSAILDNTDPIPSLSGITITGGRLNAARALGVPPEPDFTLSASPSSRTVARAGTTSYTVTIGSSNGFAGSVGLSVTGLPTGASGSFTVTPATSTSALEVTANNATPLGTFPLTITGVSGALAHSTTVTMLVVQSPPVRSCPAFVQGFYLVDSPSAAATGDFNRDGKADLAVADVNTNRISILLGDGTGAFQSAVPYTAGGAPVSVAIGDFNRDGKADLAVANAGSNNVSVLLGNGDGKFQTAVNYGTGTSPFSVVAGDFNGDGKSDLAVANNGSGNVSVLLGQGDGTFQAAVQYGTGSGPFWVATGDLNGDGKADLVVADHNADEVSILLGNGDGSFGAAVEQSAGDGPSGVAIGDFDGDGRNDLAVSNYFSNNVSILIGNGDGTFQAPVHFAVDYGLFSVAAGDINGDGKLDLTTANGTSGNVSVLLGNGNGTFLAPIHVAAGDEPNQVAIGDFNADGRPDLAVANTGSSYVTILLNSSICSLNCGTYSSAVSYTAGTTPRSQAAGDLDGDGNSDLAIANGGGDSVSILLGNGDGTFQTGGSYGAGSAPASVAAGDFNGDGKLDLATANADSDDISILIGNGDATFQTAVAHATGNDPRSIASGDFNGDGKSDLVTANSASNDATVLLGNGDGTFQTAVSYAAGTSANGVAAGDFNGDGKSDLAVANSGSSNISILLGNGDGTFQTAVNFNAGTSPSAIVASDFNGDGKPDLVVANSGSNDISVLLGNGNGTFQTAVNYASGTNPYGVAAGDFNGDGKADLSVANHGSNNVSVLFGTGTGAFAAGVLSTAGTSPAFVVAADFNGDGKPDLGIANSGSNDVSILLNTCPESDLAVTKTHAGDFVQSDSGKVYTITVTNVGGGPTEGTVKATDVLPAGLIATGMSGTGWVCVVGSASCTRNDALASGASYPDITLTVNVASNAAASVTNRVVVSGGEELNEANDTAEDPTTIAPVTDLVIAVSHAGNFTQGNVGRSYTIIAGNAGGLATSGTVTVAGTLPSGLTATALSGTGWTCLLGSLTCTRGDTLAGAGSYPPISLTVSVAANAPVSVTNTASVSGGGESNTANDTASDPTVIWSSDTCGSFGGPVNYSAGYSPSKVVKGNFNGDPYPDLVVLNSFFSYVTILLGAGDGTFADPVSYLAGDGIDALAIGDLNHDGNTDIVVSSYYSQGAFVLLGHGDGTFASPVFYSIGTYSSTAVAVADFNLDGNLDVAVLNANYYKLYIMLGNGDGTLQSAVGYAMPYYPQGMTVADLNLDARPDLVIASNSGAFVLLGNGDGTFQDASLLGLSSVFVAAGELNGDGKPDLALVDYYSGNVTIAIGNGDGTFQPALSYPTGYGSASAAIDDINGDGKADLIIASAGTNSVFTLLGNGDGSFQTATQFFAGSGANDVVLGDFNADGKPDLAVAAYYASQVAILLGGCPDLTMTKTHTGDFYGGQKDVQYSLVVHNSGGGTARAVTVTDQLPTGLTAVSMFGSGWSCTLADLTCTYGDSFGAGESYPPITLFVNVSPSAPASVTNTATVSGGGDTNPANNSASDPTTILKVPDLVITKTHLGTFAHGQTGKTYSITVGNGGGAATSGTVTVTDFLPFGLTATAMTGPGWTCNLATRICTRADALGPGQSYPPITLTVSVGNTAPQAVTNFATATGGGESFTGNDSVEDFTKILMTPANLTATPISASQVGLSWDPVAYATSYQILRSTSKVGPFLVIGIPLVNNFIDTSLSPNTTYLYKVQAADPSAVGAPSNVDLATTMMFTDDPVIPGSMVKAIHVTELRAAVNAVRAAAGLAPTTFADPSLAGALIKASHLVALRTSLDEARSTLGLPAIVYTDPALAAGITIKAAHLRELRSGVK